MSRRTKYEAVVLAARAWRKCCGHYPNCSRTLRLVKAVDALPPSRARGRAKR